SLLVVTGLNMEGRALHMTGRFAIPAFSIYLLKANASTTHRRPHMGWQGRASWLTILVLLWFMTQGTLAVTGAPGAQTVIDDPETEMWSLVRNSLHPADVAAFLQAYPNGKYAPAARLKLQQLQRYQAPSGPQGMPFPSPPAGMPEPLSAMRNSIGMELVLIPIGEFMMGSDYYQADERP